MIEQLQSAEVQDFIRSNENEDVHNLALKLKDGINGVPVAELANQIKGLKASKKKLPEWYRTKGIIWPPYISMEQCSSEATARKKVAEIQGNSFIDLTGGLGVDAYYFSKRFRNVHYVEQNEQLCRLAEHNFRLLDAKNITVVHQSAEDYLYQMQKVDTIYIDPARRNEAQKKVFQIEDCTPDILKLMPVLLQKSEQVLIKYSPLLDIQLLLQKIPEVTSLLILAVRNECKELVATIHANKKGEGVDITALNVGQTPLHFKVEDEQNCISEFGPVSKYLYEPNAAIMKAGVFKLVGTKFRLKKLHLHTHLYTSDLLVEDFPGRIFEVKTTLPLDKKKIKKELPDKKANISVRNFPIQAADVQKKLGLKNGGDVYLFGYRNFENQVRIAITKKVKVSNS